ncbi:putative protein kinase RLK-Pelle-LRR-III family [Helianthus debilis subsp. tardiflorus]
MQTTCLMVMMMMVLLLVSLALGTPELDSLLGIKRGIIIQDGKKALALGSWNPKSLASNGCPLDWYGITCSSGHVTALMLDDLGLLGNFTFAFITGLPMLRNLSISGNRFHGTITNDTAIVLKQLKYLDLHSNDFSGNVMDLLSHLGGVVYVDLSSNAFTGTLDLGLGSDEFVSAIEYLNILRLGSNRLSGSLPEALLQETSMVLSELDLSLNELKGPVDSISSTTLRSLNLSSNKLTGVLPLIIGHCAVIDLSNNLLSGNLSRIQGWGNYVEEINLSSNLLTGSFPIQTSQFLRLTSLKISNNSVGGVLSGVLATYPEIKSIDFSHNQFTGAILPSLFNATRLTYLNMSFNNFSGTIPVQENNNSVASLLEFLDLSHNSLTNHLPREIANYQKLTLLDVSNNFLEGGIPDNLPGALKVLNVSYNNLSGVVPENLKNFPDSAFHPGNDLLRFPFSPPNMNTGHRPKKRSYIMPVLIAGLIGGVFSLALLTFIVCYRAQSKPSAEKQQEISSVLATSAPNSSPKLSTTSEHRDFGAKRKAEEAFPPSSSHEVCSPDKLIGELHLFHSSLVFGAQELSSAPAEMIGRSCHGTLYKAVLESGHVLAVKWLKEGIAKGKKEFAREVTKLGNIKHPNLVSLQGYYWGPREYERMLISNYIDAPCLSLYLNEADAKNLPVLNLDDRYRIAVYIAGCLSYLHNERAIPHGNLKSTNILLEPPAMKQPLLTDYSLHRLMTSSGTAEQVLTAGALGYRPPEFCSTSKPCPSLKSDVYAFGVILLELVTGKCSAEMILGSSGEVVDLTEWVSLLCVENRCIECVNSQMLNNSDNMVKVAQDMIQVALRCILPADERPDMKSVMDDLTLIAAL